MWGDRGRALQRASHRCAKLRNQTRGGTLVEILIVICCVALLALGGFRLFGQQVKQTAERTADCVASLQGCDGQQGANADADAPVSSTTPLPRSTAESPAAAYEERLRSSLATLQSSFDTIARGDGRIDEDDLEAALQSSDPAIRDAAAFLLDNDSARHAVDVGAGRGDVDGEISLDDVRGLNGQLNDSSLATLLADTADGEGGRDGNVSRDDLEALAADQGAPPEIRAWAEARLAEMPQDEGCGGWTNFSCHIGNAAGWAYDQSGLDSLVDQSGLDSAAGWVDRNIYQNLPTPLRGAWDFYYGFNVLGPVRAVTGVVDGVGGLLQLGQTYGENLIDDPGGTLMATADFLTNPVAQGQFAWNLGSAIVSDYAERCPSSATEAGACGFEVALEVALAVTTGGAGNTAAHADDLRYVRYANHLDDATDTARVLNRLDDLPQRPFGWQDVNIGAGPGSRTINCTRCVIAVDSTLDGAPSSALGIMPGQQLPNARLAEALGRPPTAWQPAADRAAVEAAVGDWGHGSKGVVYVSRNDGTAHVFNVINDQGDILFVDGQTGRLADIEFNDTVNGIEIIRTNDWTLRPPP